MSTAAVCSAFSDSGTPPGSAVWFLRRDLFEFVRTVSPLTTASGTFIRTYQRRYVEEKQVIFSANQAASILVEQLKPRSGVS